MGYLLREMSLKRGRGATLNMVGRITFIATHAAVDDAIGVKNTSVRARALAREATDPRDRRRRSAEEHVGFLAAHDDMYARVYRYPCAFGVRYADTEQTINNTLTVIAHRLRVTRGVVRRRRHSKPLHPLFRSSCAFSSSFRLLFPDTLSDDGQGEHRGTETTVLRAGSIGRDVNTLADDDTRDANESTHSRAVTRVRAPHSPT